MSRFRTSVRIGAIVIFLINMFLVSQTDSNAIGVFLQTATLTPNKTSGTAPMLVNFSVQVGPASDAGCAQASYILSFGDGQTAQGAGSGSVNHVYNSAGEYDAMLVYTREENVGSATPDCRQQQANASVRITATAAADPSEVREPIRYIGTDSNWYNPDNWDQGRVPGEGDSVEIPEGTVVRIEDADIGVSKIDLFGELELVNSCFESELAGWGYASSAVRLNPSCFVANEIENGGLGQTLIVGLGGIEPARPGATGRSHYANIRANRVDLTNTMLDVELFYDFMPSEGDEFVIVEAEDSMTGRFSHLNDDGTLSDLEDGEVVMTFDDLEIAIEYQPNRAILHCRKIGKQEDF